MPDDEHDEHEHHAHAIGMALPAEMVRAMMHDRSHALGRAEDRYNSSMRWLDSLDVEGLMALRYILACEPEGAFGNARFYDGMVVQLLRRKEVDPNTGRDPAAALLEAAGGAPVESGGAAG